MCLISVLADMLINTMKRDSIGRCFGAVARFHSARRSGEERPAERYKEREWGSETKNCKEDWTHS